jgi:leader peptidase (prepilin peptidase)/N-methyltransferase
MSTALFVVAFVAFGFVIGSFLNTVIVRVPAKEPLMAGKSRCPLCDAPIALRDNIPVASWFLLRGRCRTCQGPIPLAYPLVELANVGLWLLALWRFGIHPEMFLYAALFSVLLALSVIDLELYILPNRITYPSILLSVPVLVMLSYAVSDDPGRDIKGALVGGFGFAGFLAVTLIAYELIVRKEGMGIGDVKLAMLLGLWLGWIDPLLVLYGLIAASVLGVLVGVGVLVVRRASQPYPFGPWLAIGTIVVILASRSILESIGR